VRQNFSLEQIAAGLHCRSSFNHPAHSLCGAQEISESQILNANPLCKNFRQGV